MYHGRVCDHLRAGHTAKPPCRVEQIVGKKCSNGPSATKFATEDVRRRILVAVVNNDIAQVWCTAAGDSMCCTVHVYQCDVHFAWVSACCEHVKLFAVSHAFGFGTKNPSHGTCFFNRRSVRISAPRVAYVHALAKFCLWREPKAVSSTHSHNPHES